MNTTSIRRSSAPGHRGESSTTGFLGLAARAAGAIEKAIREAKRNTSWIDPNRAYEEAVRSFVERLLERDSALRARMGVFASRIMMPGLLTSLAQLVVKATAPGVPDFFQGTELWDFSMVDPDNRRPVDFARRGVFSAISCFRARRIRRASPAT